VFQNEFILMLYEDYSLRSSIKRKGIWSNNTI